MTETLSRSQVRLVAAMYAAMAVCSGLLIFERYLVYLRNPQDVAAAGGMYAGGDLLLEIMVLCLFLVPTAVLIFFLRQSEVSFAAYAKVLLGVSLTAPLALGLMFVPIANKGILGEAIFFRLVAIPAFAIASIVSLCVARFRQARRLIACALLLEALPFAIAIGFLVFASRGHHG